MSKRTLAAVAVIVLGVGILLTVFVVSSLWLSAGHSIPRQVLRGIPLATLLVAALSAAGTFTAAAVALRIATTDRRSRRDEHRQRLDAADWAEARLIVVEPSRHTTGKPQVKVGNFGTRSVLDVELTRLDIPGRDEPVPDRRVIPVVAPARDSPRHDNRGNPQFAGGIFTYYDRTDLLIGVETGDIKATVEFTDIRGKTWEATFMASTEHTCRTEDLIRSTERQSIRQIRGPGTGL